MIERFETFTYAISAISHYWNKIAADEMQCYGLKGVYAIYLMALYHHPDGITSAALCEMCKRDKADISRSVAVLEKKGLVTRQNITSNSYRALILLTCEGRRVAESVRRRVSVVVDAAGSGISDENRIVFYNTLETIVSNMKKISEEGVSE